MEFIDIYDAIIGAVLGAIFAYFTTYFFHYRNRRTENHNQFKINIANLLALLTEAKEHWFLIIEYYYLKQIEIQNTSEFKRSLLNIKDDDFEKYRLKMISLNSEIIKSIEVLKSFQLEYGTRIKNRINDLNLDGNQIPLHYLTNDQIKKLSPHAVSHTVGLRFSDQVEIGGRFENILNSLRSKLSENEAKFDKLRKS